MPEYTDTSMLGQRGLQRLIQRIKLALAGKQDVLVSGTNIKTVNGSSLVGSGNLQVGEGLTYELTKNGHTISLTDSDGNSTTVQDGYLQTSLTYAPLTRVLTLNGESSSVTFPVASYGSNGVPGLVTSEDKKRIDSVQVGDNGSIALRTLYKTESGPTIVVNDPAAPGGAARMFAPPYYQRISLTAVGNLRLDVSSDGSTWYPAGYFSKNYMRSGLGDDGTVDLTGFNTVGYVTSGGQSVRFTIPLARPVDTSVDTVSIRASSDLSVQCGFIFRQGGNYTHGSGASTPVCPADANMSCSLRVDRGCVDVALTLANTANAINNDTVGINVSNMYLHFS